MKANSDMSSTPPGQARRQASGSARVRRWALVVAMGFAVGAPVGALTAHAPQWADGICRADATFMGRVAAAVPSSVREVATMAWGLIRGGESVSVAIADAVFRVIPEREAVAPPSPLLDDGDIRLVPELKPVKPAAPQIAVAPTRPESPGRERGPGHEPAPGRDPKHADAGNPFVFPMITRLREAWAQRPNLPMGLGGFGAIAPAIVGGPMFVPLPDDLATLWLTPGTPDVRAGQPLATLPPIPPVSPGGPKIGLRGRETPGSELLNGDRPGTSPAPGGGKSRAFRPQAGLTPSSDRAGEGRPGEPRRVVVGLSAPSQKGVSAWSLILPDFDRGFVISITPGRVQVRRVDPG